MNTQYEAFKKDTNYTREVCKEGFPVILDRYTHKLCEYFINDTIIAFILKI